MTRPRRKRLLRISLRMVFVLTTILCIWLGYKVRQVKQQREAITWIQEHGGRVIYDFEISDALAQRRPGPVDLKPPGPKWAHDLFGVDYFVTPVYASVIYDGDLNDISPLANLPGLIDLNIGGGVVKDLSPLLKLQNLECLTLHGCEPLDLSPLLKLKRLKALGLSLSTAVEEVTRLREALPDCSVVWMQSH